MPPDRIIDVEITPRGESPIGVETTDITVYGSFVLRFRGHHVPAHVHARADDALRSVATIEQTNHYVEPGETLDVGVTVEQPSERVTGSIEIATRYGADSVTLTVTVEPRSEPVAVDGSLADPSREAPDGPTPDRFNSPSNVDVATLGVLALAVVTFAIAVATATVVGGTVAFFGLLVVLVGVAVAVFLLRS